MTPELTTAEIEAASRYLLETRDALVESTRGLAGSDWDLKPDPDRWSVAEIIEHVAVVEGRVHAIIGRLPDAVEAAPEQPDRDEFIRVSVPSRETSISAPPPTHPSGRWSGEGCLTEFLKMREGTIGMLKGSSLRGRVVPHPLFGPLDGYQWIMAVAGHSARHTAQIREARSQCAQA